MTHDDGVARDLLGEVECEEGSESVDESSSGNALIVLWHSKPLGLHNELTISKLFQDFF